MDANSFVIDLQQLDGAKIMVLLKTLISSPWCSPDCDSIKFSAGFTPLQIFKELLRCKPLFEVLSGDDMLHLLEWSTAG
jgi:hypothetical protein